MKKRILLTALCAAAFVCAGAALQTENVKAETETETGTPTVSIYAQTLALEENIHIKYAVATENVSESNESGLLVWRESQETYEYGTQDTLITVFNETLKEEENEYPVYAFAELSAKEMVDTVYAVAYVEAGGEYYYSPVKKYSILEYAYNMLGKTEAEGTDEESLKTLLNAILAYGGAAQTYFGYKTETLASDKFSYVRIENATFADGFSYGLFEAGAEVIVTPDEGYELSATAAEYLTTNEAGEIVLTVPTEKTVDTTSFVIPSQGSQGLAYTLNADGVSYSVTGIGTCTDTEVVIPSTYEGLPVTGIGSSAFKNCSNLKSVTIPDCITIIGHSAFDKCSELISITIPDGITRIGDALFRDCSNLASITIPDGVTSIGGDAFRSCSNLTSITIPEGVTSIEGYAFDYCNNLTSIEIPDSVTSIGNYVFGACSSLATITIPIRVTSISKSLFIGCSSLTSVTIVGKVTNVGESAFYYCDKLTTIYYNGTAEDWANVTIGSNNTPLTSATVYYYSEEEPTADGDYWHYDTDGVTPVVWVYVPSEGVAYILNADGVSYSVTGIGTCTDTEVVIPSIYEGLPVTGIGSSAFKGCNNLTSIVIPNSIETMGDYAISSCSNLKSATIGSNVWKIGASAFFDCGNLMEVTILEGVNSIGENAFKNCSNLIDVTIPSSVTSIGNGVFYGCSALQNLTLPEGIKSIANETFYGCVALSDIKIPESVLSIGSNAFYNCSALSTVTIPDKVKSIGIEAFYGCADLSELTIGNSVTSIGNMAFGRCQKLMSLTIPDSVTSVEYGAFSNCYNLENLTIGNGITELPMGIFALCSSLKEVVIPKNVTRIGSAFQDCTALESVLILGDVTNIGDYAFYNCSNLKIVYYNGAEEKWANVTIGSNNTPLTDATVYYYSENEPEVNEEGTAYDGNYWHYDTDGVTPVVWTKTEE